MSLSILSFLAIVSVLPISFVARDFHWKSGLLLARQLTLPMGLIVTLLLLVKTSGNNGRPFTVFTLGRIHASQCVCIDAVYILSQIDFTSSQPHQDWQIRLATGSLVGIVLLYAGLQGFLQSIIAIDTLCTLGVGIFGLRWLQRRFPSTKAQTVGNLALQVAFLNACYRSTQLILYWEDPTTVGPNMASIMLGLMYGFIIWMLSEVRSELDPTSPPLEHPISSSMIIGTFFLSYAPIILFSLTLNLWHMNKQTNELHLQTDYQHQLLREMAVQNDDNNSGHITVSSDKPAWIFIDDRLVSTSPLFKHDLDPGEHTIKIASCPTYDFMKPEDNISWNDYWSMASDGSCREPSEQELNELIAQGLAKEIIVETVDEYAMMQIEYQPGVNFVLS